MARFDTLGLMKQLRAWFRNPQVVDWVIALTILALGFIGEVTIGGTPTPVPADYRAIDFVGYLLIFAQTLPLAYRRTHPQAVAAIIGLAWAMDRGLNYPPSAAGFAILIAMHAVGAYLPPKRSARFGWTVAGLIVAWTGVGMLTLDVVGIEALISMALGSTIPLVIGREVYQRRRRVRDLERRAEEAERDRTEQARRAVALERGRIARELHDVVAHEVTVMTLQAEGMLRSEPGADRPIVEALNVIAKSGRDALDEMQRMVGLLRSETEDETDLRPQPTLAGLGILVDQLSDAGLPVDLTIDGDPRPLSPGLELTVYRIVQESLTNSLKYAGPGATAAVTVGYRGDRVELVVVDDGRGTSFSPNGSGHGLVGMQERVALHGGELKTGPRQGGGFEVLATLPVPA